MIPSLKNVVAGMIAAFVALALHAQERKAVPPGTPVTITVQPATLAAPPTSFTLGARHAHVTPVRTCHTHTGGGNVDVAQPSPDVVVITMSGACVAYGCVCDSSARMDFDLEQDLEVSFDNPKVKLSKVTIEGRVIGLLRSGCLHGSAGYDGAHAVISGEAGAMGLDLTVPPHFASGGQSMSVNDHVGPVSLTAPAGKYHWHQTFNVSASAGKCILPMKGPSAEFAPDPAVDPLWLPYNEAFHGSVKKDFGFQVTIKVAEDSEAAPPPAPLPPR